MVRTIVGVFITLVCLALDPSLGIASGVVTGVWVLLWDRLRHPRRGGESDGAPRASRWCGGACCH